MQIEHRYFGESKILSDTRWEYLTLEQAAADLHAIIQALKPLLPKEWISTGASKDGMASIYLRYYYPDDIDVTTAFCAPLMTSMLDLRTGRYMQQECGKGDVKPIVDSHINRLFVNGKDGIYARYCQIAEEKTAAKGVPYIAYSFEKYVYTVLLTTFSFYMLKDAKKRQETIPPIDCPNDSLIKFFCSFTSDQDYHFDEYYWEERPGYPFDIQKAKQLGYVGFDYSLYPQLEGTGFDAAKADENPFDLFERDLWLYDTYDNSVHLDILNNFLPNFEKPVLLVYSQHDPWTGARVTNVNPVTKVIINPGGYHNQEINNTDLYDPALRQEIIDYIGKYVKLP